MSEVSTTTDLYAKQRKIYPKATQGIFAKYRVLSVFVLLGLYYGFPWIEWNGRQAVLFDLPNRQFHYFGVTFWPHDFIYLSLLLIIAALSLFFFTALAGRLWCGYACPQTVWTKVFLWIEKAVEGERNKRMKLDASPWSLKKFRIKFTKHAAWLIFAAFTGYTFVGYFTPIRELSDRLLVWDLGYWEGFWVIFYSLATYFNAGKLREQVCIYMCPYARFQSAMFDKDTLIISYDEARGEARGSRSRKVDRATLDLGDCIDCKACVHVCPTGIDIRDGLQYQCIACAACIDVCNEVMEKMDYSKNLIHYTTEHQTENKATHIVRPRIIIYAAVLLLLIGGFSYALWQRIPLELDIIRDRNSLYVLNDQGRIENIFTLKVLNMDQQPHEYAISIEGLPNISVQGAQKIKVAAGEQVAIPIRVAVAESSLTTMSTDLIFSIVSLDAPSHRQEEVSHFIGPAPNTNGSMNR